MRKRVCQLIGLCSVFILFSCSRMTPAGFWKSFEKNRLVEIVSDQGPRGGHRAIYWNADQENYFDAKKVIGFAEEKGWKLIDSIKFRSNELKSWNDGKSQFFPLSQEGFTPNPLKNSVYKYFPRWINDDLTVFSFETDWVSIQPGSDSSAVNNGFVVISADGRKMSVYHIWGE
jgi:hypothetical protein